MRVLLFAVALATLSACTSNAPLSPEEAVAASQAAVEAGDAQEATRMLKAAARNGDLHAMATLAVAYQQGYYQRGPILANRPGARHLATRQSDPQAQRWINRFVETVRRPSADPTHQHLLALDLLNGQRQPESPSELWSIRRNMSRATPAQRDSAITILEHLLEQGHPGVAFALAATTDHRDEKVAIYRTAAEHGDVHACFFAARGAHPWGRSAVEMANYLEARTECEAMPGSERVDHTSPLEALRAQVQIGNLQAVALMDSLVVLGAIPDA